MCLKQKELKNPGGIRFRLSGFEWRHWLWYRLAGGIKLEAELQSSDQSKQRKAQQWMQNTQACDLKTRFETDTSWDKMSSSLCSRSSVGPDNHCMKLASQLMLSSQRACTLKSLIIRALLYLGMISANNSEESFAKSFVYLDG